MARFSFRSIKKSTRKESMYVFINFLLFSAKENASLSKFCLHFPYIFFFYKLLLNLNYHRVCVCDFFLLCDFTHLAVCIYNILHTEDFPLTILVHSRITLDDHPIDEILKSF